MFKLSLLPIEISMKLAGILNAIRQRVGCRMKSSNFLAAASGHRRRSYISSAANQCMIPFSTVSKRKVERGGAKVTPIPAHVADRLKTLKEDAISALLAESNFEQKQTNSQMSESGCSVEQIPLSLNVNLMEMAQYYFQQSGKLFRPTISLLMSSACNQKVDSSATADISINQYYIAIISEMIHTASLVHDDVIDESDTRRGQPTANERWGNRQAVLVGDFILSRATRLLCQIGQPKVISTMAEIVEDLVKGELMQLSCSPNLNAVERFQHYIIRTFYKSASLFANSCKSVAMLSGADDRLQEDAFEFGRHLGIAFQLVDDILDYVSSSAVLGKPAANDLRLGLATCPVLYAAQQHPELNALIARRFKHPGDVDNAYALVMDSNGLTNTRQLAKQHCDAAIDIVNKLPNGSMVRDCLIEILLTQLERDH